MVGDRRTEPESEEGDEGYWMGAESPGQLALSWLIVVHDGWMIVGKRQDVCQCAVINLLLNTCDNRRGRRGELQFGESLAALQHSISVPVVTSDSKAEWWRLKYLTIIIRASQVRCYLFSSHLHP